jgi:glycosyltransferase involved in cell wall biosynthesis
MRLLFVHERIGALGGAEANVLATAGELRQRGHTVALAHGRGTSHGETEWRTTFAPCFPLAADSSAQVTSATVARALAEFQPDVVFLHKFSDPAVLTALLAAGRPLVRMVHDHDLYCMRGYKYNVVTRHICTRAASAYCIFPCGASLARNPAGPLPLRWVSYADKRREIALNRHIPHLVVASAYMRDELLRNGFAADRIETHAPVPRPTPSADHPSFSARNLIVYAGQIIRGKGVDVLLESLAKVTAPFECVILGDGNQRAECEKLSTRLGLQDRVRFEGFVPQARIADYYRDASLAVMSSLWPEPFGATGLEAMRCGLPVVAFAAGGIGEWLLDGENGFLVPWMDRSTFAVRVDTLLRDKPLARRLGETGRRLANDRFSFSTYLDGLENLFVRAATRRSALQPLVVDVTA